MTAELFTLLVIIALIVYVFITIYNGLFRDNRTPEEKAWDESYAEYLRENYETWCEVHHVEELKK